MEMLDLVKEFQDVEELPDDDLKSASLKVYMSLALADAMLERLKNCQPWEGEKENDEYTLMQKTLEKWNAIIAALISQSTEVSGDYLWNIGIHSRLEIQGNNLSIDTEMIHQSKEK